MNTFNEQKHTYKNDKTNYYPNHNFSKVTEVSSNNKKFYYNYYPNAITFWLDLHSSDEYFQDTVDSGAETLPVKGFC